MLRKESDMPLHLFHHGENFKAYQLLGAHKEQKNKQSGYVFRVWAPRAVSVSVIGDFNNWNENSHVMERMVDNNCQSMRYTGLAERLKGKGDKTK